LVACIGFDDSVTLSSGEKNSFAIVLLLCILIAVVFVVLDIIKSAQELLKKTPLQIQSGPEVECRTITMAQVSNPVTT
jgi:hypothetical protein